jgi:hypothetical protein
MPEQTCRTCRFYLGWANGVDGECRWKPPPACRPKDWHPLKAPTDKDDWCSAHQEK